MTETHWIKLVFKPQFFTQTALVSHIISHNSNIQTFESYLEKTITKIQIKMELWLSEVLQLELATRKVSRNFSHALRSHKMVQSYTQNFVLFAVGSLFYFSLSKNFVSCNTSTFIMTSIWVSGALRTSDVNLCEKMVTSSRT